MKLDLRKIYRFEPVSRPENNLLPKGGDIYYECMGCKSVVSSVSTFAVSCDCGNLAGGGGKIEAKSPDQVTPLRGRLK